MNFAAGRFMGSVELSLLSTISELFDTALENCRDQTQQMPGAPQPPVPQRPCGRRVARLVKAGLQARSPQPPSITSKNWRSSRSRNGHRHRIRRHRIRRVNHPSRHSLRISAFRPSVRNAFPCCISRGGTRRRYVHPGFDNHSQP